MAIFTTLPNKEPVSTRQPRVRAIKYGDGYEQRALDGLHADLQRWELSFQDRTTAEIDAVEAFFVSNQTAVFPFIWTPPSSGVAGKFVCRAWRRIPVSFDVETITATFEEVADP